MGRPASAHLAAALSAGAATLLLSALVLNADMQGSASLLSRCSLADNTACGIATVPPESLQSEEAPLVFNEDGSISADTVRQWRKKVSAVPGPDSSHPRWAVPFWQLPSKKTFVFW